jgi:hypothetical protein
MFNREANPLLPIEIKRYLYTKLSISLGLEARLFPLLENISNVMINIIETKREEIIQLLTQDSIAFANLKYDLYRDHQRGALGSIPKEKYPEDIDEVLNDIVNALKNHHSNILTIMPIHKAFCYWITRILYRADYISILADYKDALFLFEKSDKYVTRKAADREIILTQQLGIGLSEQTNQLINALPEIEKIRNIMSLDHRNSLQRFQINSDVEIFDEFRKHNLPLVAGLSGFTINLLCAIKVYAKNFPDIGLLTNEDLYNYAFAYFIYLNTAGYNSFDEVMYIASVMLGLDYQWGSLVDNIPKQLRDFVTNLFIDDVWSEYIASSSKAENNLVGLKRFGLLHHLHDEIEQIDVERYAYKTSHISFK